MNISVEEYDERIRTFVPTYEEMISVVAQTLRVVPEPLSVIVDLGVGTGELTNRCRKERPEASFVGIDMDPAMLAIARDRLKEGVTLIEGDFCRVPLPPCDAMVSCIALHHIKDARQKQEFYKRCARALRPGGYLISADCYPSEAELFASVQKEAWLRHMQKKYSRAEAEAHLAAWADEDVYVPLAVELRWMEEAGFETEVLWRMNAFAAIAARRPAA
jgi:ubiquinone/menaquinone biosynthesis C-methylase UbiE